MKERGIFSPEGLLEGGLYSDDEVVRALAAYDSTEHAYVAVVCPYHEGHEEATCEECLLEGDER
jgi:hypothetical protein